MIIAYASEPTEIKRIPASLTAANFALLSGLKYLQNSLALLLASLADANR